jgi:hypothetical protein
MYIYKCIHICTNTFVGRCTDTLHDEALLACHNTSSTVSQGLHTTCWEQQRLDQQLHPLSRRSQGQRVPDLKPETQSIPNTRESGREGGREERREGVREMTEGTSDIDTQTMSALILTTLHGNGDSDGHLMSILGLVLGLRAKHILELGVRQGRTTLPLLMAAKLTGGMVVNVDIQDTSFETPMALMTHWTFVKMDELEFLWTLDTSAHFGHHGSVSDTSSALDLVYIDD